MSVPCPREERGADRSLENLLLRRFLGALRPHQAGESRAASSGGADAERQAPEAPELVSQVSDRGRPVARLTGTEYGALVEQAPIMIWRADGSAACDYFNERWLEFTGRTLEQELGDGWAEGVHPEDRHRCLSIYREAFERREVFEMEYRLRRHDGDYCWVFDRGVPLFAPADQFVGYVGSCVDVTERVVGRELIRRAAEQDLQSLRGLLTICSHCKKIRDGMGQWQRLESYLAGHSRADFSHGICPHCLEEHFPEC
ncbi:MAG: PAS domain-containing protein [Deltaproteobacteria bacterium]|nr:PAS domain-containing protein [Deltaproteobacteria bacterium]